MQVEDVPVAASVRPEVTTAFVVDIWTHPTGSPQDAWLLARYALHHCDGEQAVQWARAREGERTRALVFATAGLDSPTETWLWLYGQNPNGYTDTSITLHGP
ncbi:MAG TPA: hypothetical protein VIL55_14605 [Naasia sp.]|jgi:hypothetical protein